MITASETASHYASLTSRLPEIEARYRKLTPRSLEAFERAARVFPGGYTRDAIIRSPHPTFVQRASGVTLHDLDGRPLTDFWFNATSLALGHAFPAVVDAIGAQLPHGTAYFAPTENEVRLAEVLLDRLPGAERIRFANSGSEAVMIAVRFARAFRASQHRDASTIVKFEGSYHGTYDDVSWSVSPRVSDAGAGDSPRPVAETAGLAGTQGRVAVLPYNDIAALRRYIETHHAGIAAVLVEPMANRIGLVMPDVDFLAEARALCTRFRIALIFDEVISFRVGYRGVQGEVGLRPDLTTLGKIVGGGFPVGAVAGRADILDLSSPGGGGRVVHAGTFNANPMTAIAGRVTMETLTPDALERMNALGDYARQRLADSARGLPLQVTGAGSLFKVTATPRAIRNYRDAATTDKAWESACSLALHNEGFVLTPTMSGCTSLVTTRAHVDALVSAFESVVAR
jgi:glutamate-1-semialdehyde 2,1-aminomutase